MVSLGIMPILVIHWLIRMLSPTLFTCPTAKLKACFVRILLPKIIAFIWQYLSIKKRNSITTRFYFLDNSVHQEGDGVSSWRTWRNLLSISTYSYPVQAFAACQDKNPQISNKISFLCPEVNIYIDMCTCPIMFSSRLLKM